MAKLQYELTPMLNGTKTNDTNCSKTFQNNEKGLQKSFNVLQKVISI